MLDDRESMLKLYSLGIVTVDKPDGTDVIDVLPVEELPSIKGAISDFKPKFDNKLPSAQGVAQSATVTAGGTIQATWLPHGQSNRMTSPDVIKNETVLLFRYADTDKYYWTTLFREPGIRRLENVVYAYGNLTAPLKGWDSNSSYYARVTTKDKFIQVHTSKSNGEPFEYDIKIETATGSVTIKDDVGNSIVLNSRPQQITLTNGAGTKHDMIGPDLNVTVPGNYSVSVGGSYSLTAGSTTSTSAGSSASVSAGTNASLAGGISASVSGVISTHIETPSLRVTAPDCNIN